MRLICEISRAVKAIKEEQDGGTREGGEEQEEYDELQYVSCVSVPLPDNPAMRSTDAC